MGGPQSRSGRFWKREKSFIPTGIRVPDRPAGSLVAIPTTLFRPLNNICNINILIIKPNNRKFIGWNGLGIVSY